MNKDKYHEFVGRIIQEKVDVCLQLIITALKNE